MVIERPALPTYDAIAHLYDVDMARSMPFDDVAFYERICRDTGVPVLELADARRGRPGQARP